MDWRIDLDTAFSDVFRKRNLLLLAFFWIAGGLMLAVYGTQSIASTESPFFPSGVNLPSSSVQGTGPFTAWRKGGQTIQGPAYKISFDNLWADNVPTEIAESTSRKTIHIDNLAITFLRSSAECDSTGNVSNPLAEFHNLFAPASGGDLPGVLAWMQDGLPDLDVFTDLTNAAEVLIHDLDWRVSRDGITILYARCMEAELPAARPEILLRGYATLTSEDATLEGNDIRIDVQADRVVASGPYVVKYPGWTHTGAGTYLDTALWPVSGSPTQSECPFTADKTWFSDDDAYDTRPAWQGLLEAWIQADRRTRPVQTTAYEACDPTTNRGNVAATIVGEGAMMSETAKSQVESNYFLCWKL